MRREGIMHGELILLDDEVNPVLSTVLAAALDVTGLGPTLLSEQPRLLAMNIIGEGTFQTLGTALRTALDEARRVRNQAPKPSSSALRAKDLNVSTIRNHLAGEHPQVLFVRIWGQGSASELAKGLRYALDVQVGAERPAAQ